MRKSNKKVLWLSALALALVIIATIGPALAYFTTYVEAKGGHTLYLEREFEIYEKVSGTEKTIAIENTGKMDIYGRIKIFSGQAFDSKITPGADWVPGEADANGFQYWYYTKALKPAEKSSEIKVSVGNIPADYEYDFDVVVIGECTPYMCDTDGNPLTYDKADWSMAAQVEGGN